MLYEEAGMPTVGGNIHHVAYPMTPSSIALTLKLVLGKSDDQILILVL
jgi:hypothetical protein